MIAFDLLSGIVCLALIAIIYNQSRRSKSGLPKGPQGYPVLGNLPQFANSATPQDIFVEWAKKFGDLYTVYIGLQPALIINDSKLLKQLFSQHAGAGKFKNDTFLLMVRGPYGQVLSEGADHAEQRVHFRKIIKHFEFGSWKIDHRLLPQITTTCDNIQALIGTKATAKFFPSEVMKETAIHTLWNLATGETNFEGDCKEFIRLLNIFEVSFARTVKTGLALCPWLKTFFPKWSGYTDLDIATYDVNQLVRHTFKKQRESMTEDDEPRHFIDFYLEAIDKANDETRGAFYGEEGFNQALGSVTELFIGGVMTQSSTLTMLIYRLSFDKKAQRKLQAEIDEVVGKERSPSLNDRTKMPYAEAAILEAIRILSVNPLGLFHEVVEDVDFHGYSLKKGMPLIPNLYWIQHNPETWGDPEVFRPERFIENPKMKEFVVAFQPGKRSCPGEPVAKDIMFLMATSLYQRFETSPDPSVSEEDYYKTDDGVVASPYNYPIFVNQRNE